MQQTRAKHRATDANRWVAADGQNIMFFAFTGYLIKFWKYCFLKLVSRLNAVGSDFIKLAIDVFYRVSLQ